MQTFKNKLQQEVKEFKVQLKLAINIFYVAQIRIYSIV